MLTTKSAGGLVGPPVSQNEVNTVRVKITSGTVADGKRYKAGEIVEVQEHTGRQLLSFRKAVPCEDEPKKPTARKPKTTTRKKAK